MLREMLLHPLRTFRLYEASRQLTPTEQEESLHLIPEQQGTAVITKKDQEDQQQPEGGN